MTHPQPPPDGAERAEFEAWCRSDLSMTDRSFVRTGDGLYLEYDTRVLFLGWRGARRSRPAPPAAEPVAFIRHDERGFEQDRLIFPPSPEYRAEMEKTGIRYTPLVPAASAPAEPWRAADGQDLRRALVDVLRHHGMRPAAALEVIDDIRLAGWALVETRSGT